MRATVLSLFITLTLQSFAQSTIETVTIEPYKELSYGAFFKSLTISSEDTYAEYIDGFEYEWGFIYELKIKATKLKNPPMDAGDTDYELLEVISKTKASDDFRFKLRLEHEVYLGGDSAGSLEKIDENTYRYLKEINMVVPDNLLETFKTILANNKNKVGIFGFNDDGTIQLYELK
jgi:hypothetical protein